MITAVFQTLCIECGKVCGFNEMICPDCVELLEKVRHRCKNCGHPLAIEASYCRHCNNRAKGINFYYSDYFFTSAAKQMILQIKYNWRFRGAAQLGSLCKPDGIDFGRYDMVVPVPYHFLRRFMRYRQPVDIMMKALHDRYGVQASDILKRVRYTEYQSRLNRRERKINIRNVFRVNTGVKDMHILLIDDIITTGSTLIEAARALKKCGAAKVDAYTLLAGVPR